MKKIFILLLSVALLSGCCSAQKNEYVATEFDGTSSEQTIVIKHNDHYFVNMTDGIFVCSEDFSVAEQLTNEYCYDPYIKDNVLYYVGDSRFYGNDLKSLDLSTEEKGVLYTFQDYNCYRHIGNDWYVGDSNRFLKIREDGMPLLETTVNNLYFIEFINDDFFLYRLEYDNQTLMMFDIETRDISKVFSLSEGKYGSTVMCDGANIYYALINADESIDFCKYDMNTEKHKTLLKGGFGEEFNIYDGVCYFYTYNRGDLYGHIKAFDISTGNIETLLDTQYGVEDITVLDNMLFYRRTDYGKQIEVLKLEDNSTVYLYEKYADITKRVP